MMDATTPRFAGRQWLQPPGELGGDRRHHPRIPAQPHGGLLTWVPPLAAGWGRRVSIWQRAHPPRGLRLGRQGRAISWTAGQDQVYRILSINASRLVSRPKPLIGRLMDLSETAGRRAVGEHGAGPLAGASLNRIMLCRARQSNEQALTGGAELDRSGWAGAGRQELKGGAGGR